MIKEHLFDTEEKQQNAIATLRDGMNTPFWKLITDILKDNIELITEQILEGGKTKKMNRLRDRLKIHKEIVNTPKLMIKRLSPSPEGKEPNLDPYQTAEEIKKAREKASS